MTLRQRVLKLKNDANMTTETLSKLSGVPKGTINKILNGETENPRARTLRQLALALGCSPELLYDDAPLPEAPSEKSVPASCGAQITVYGESLPAALPAYDIAVRMPDPSMSGARINQGDLVFVLRDPAPQDGAIAALLIDGGLTLRRLYRIRDGLTLLSENSAFPPLVLTGDDCAKIEILGRATGFVASL
jgi:transcriptional regulator with XRE-family HTH domain